MYGVVGGIGFHEKALALSLFCVRCALPFADGTQFLDHAQSTYKSSPHRCAVMSKLISEEIRDRRPTCSLIDGITARHGYGVLTHQELTKFKTHLLIEHGINITE